MITESLSTLNIHKLTQAQYDRELAAGRIDENALYLTPDNDSGSGGVTSWNDLTDRPFGESDNAELLQITQFSFDSSLGVFFTPGNIDFVEGKSYTVNWNGTDYTTVGVSGQFNGENLVMIGNPAALGGTNNGLPFAIACLMGSIGSIPLDGSTHIHVGIRGYELKKIPEKYLPDLEFVIVLTGDETKGFTVDKTYDEILEAHENGLPIVLEEIDDYFNKARIPFSCIVNLTGMESLVFQLDGNTVRIKPDNSVEVTFANTWVTIGSTTYSSIGGHDLTEDIQEVAREVAEEVVSDHPSDMAASEEEPGHVLNRTHWVEGIDCDPYFDGNLIGRECKILSMNATHRMCLVKITDHVLTKDECVGATFVYTVTSGDGSYDSSYTVSQENISDITSDGEYAFSIAANNYSPNIIVVKKDSVYNGVEIKTGVYYLFTTDGNSKLFTSYFSAIDKPVVFHKLDNRYVDSEWLATTSFEKGDTVLDETEISFTNTDDIAGIGSTEIDVSLVIGKTYYVLLNGIDYVLLCQQDPSEPDGTKMLGNIDLGFMIHQGSDLTSCTITLINIDKCPSCTLAIYEAIETPNKLPEKFLPESATQSPDWNASEEEPGHILNRSHYVKSSEEIVIIPETTGTVSRDTGLVSLPSGATTSWFPMHPLVEGDKCILTCNGVEYPCTVRTFNYNMSTGTRVEFVIGYHGSHFPSGQYSHIDLQEVYSDAPIGIKFVIRSREGISCNQWGKRTVQFSYYSSLELGTSITFSVRKIVEDTQKIDNKYIDSDWMATSEFDDLMSVGDVIPVENTDLCITNVHSWTPADIATYSKFTNYVSAMGLPETLCVIFDGKKYFVDKTMTGINGDVPAWGNIMFYINAEVNQALPGSFGVPFALLWINDVPTILVGALNDDYGASTSTSHTVEIYAVKTNKIPDRFVSAPDWDASEGESGHIKHRTHYVEETSEEVVHIAEVTSSEKNDAGRYVVGTLLLPFEEGKIYTVNWNGVEYKCTAKPYPDDSLIALGNGVDGIYPFRIVTHATNGDLTSTDSSNWTVYAQPYDSCASVIFSVKQVDERIKKLDPKFIDAEWLAIEEFYHVQSQASISLTQTTSSAEGSKCFHASYAQVPGLVDFLTDFKDDQEALADVAFYVIWDGSPYYVKPNMGMISNLLSERPIWGNRSLFYGYRPDQLTDVRADCPFSFAFLMDNLVVFCGSEGTHTVEVYVVNAKPIPERFMPKQTFDSINLKAISTVPSSAKLFYDGSDMKVTDSVEGSKTLAYKGYVDSQVEGYADWVARDRSYWSSKTFDGEVTFDDTGTAKVSYTGKFLSNTEYTIIIGDIEYKATTGNTNTGAGKLVNPNDDTCYVMDSMLATADKICCPAYANQTVNVQIGVRVNELTILPEQHIPTSVPVIQSASVGQVITVKAVDENGRPTEWESMNYTVIPEITEADNGKVLMIVDGKLQLVNLNLAIDENGVVST